MSKNTAKIYDEIRGQLGGLGWNVAYIKTLLENQYGPLSNDQLPEEMEGSTKSVRKKRGFFGKMRDKASDIFHGIGDKFSDLKMLSLVIVINLVVRVKVVEVVLKPFFV